MELRFRKSIRFAPGVRLSTSARVARAGRWTGAAPPSTSAPEAHTSTRASPAPRSTPNSGCRETPHSRFPPADRHSWRRHACRAPVRRPVPSDKPVAAPHRTSRRRSPIAGPETVRLEIEDAACSPRAQAHRQSVAQATAARGHPMRASATRPRMPECCPARKSRCPRSERFHLPSR